MSPSPSMRSLPSVRSVVSSTAGSAKSVLKSVKGAVKKGASKITRPLKKMKTSMRASSIASSIASKATIPRDSSPVPSPNDSGNDLGSDAEVPETDEQEIERLRKGWRSPVYGFFQAKVEIGRDSGRKFHFFRCAASKCKGSGGVRRYQDSKDRAATSNLKSHAIRCFGQDVVESAFSKASSAPQDGSIFAAFARQGQQPVKVSHRAHTAQETRAHIARWCAESNRPHLIAQDRQFGILMKAGRPGTVLPSSKTVSRDIRAAFERCRERIDKILKEHPGLINFATDAWTSPNHCAFIAWTVHLHHEGHVLVFLLDIIEIPESHTGDTLAREFHDMLIEHGLENKILSITTDNATTNDKQVSRLSKLPNLFEEVNWVRCFNHTMQLSAKALLRPFSATTTTGKTNNDDISDNEDSDIPEPDGDADDDDDDDENVQESGEEDDDDDEDDGDEDPFDMLDVEEREQLMENTTAVRTTLTKVRKLAFAVINSTTIALPAWRNTCRTHGLRQRLIPRDVKTRWNSTYYMLRVASKYCLAIDDITANKTLKLRKYELDDEDWVIIDDLIRVLKVYKDATIFFSHDNIETIAHVIPTMDRIDSLLTQASTEPLTPSVKHALTFARKHINKYYSKTDFSNVYRIAMVLHPQLKLKYFAQHGWTTEWIETAMDIVKEEFKLYNKPQENGPKQTPNANTDSDNDSVDFFDIPMLDLNEQNELEDYLSQPIEKVRDPIAWWWDHRQVFPKLSMMAFNYLSIPATSTAVERVFSQGRHILHFTRNHLLPRSIQATLCFGDWSRKDLVHMPDVVAAVGRKGGQKRVLEISDED